MGGEKEAPEIAAAKTLESDLPLSQKAPTQIPRAPGLFDMPPSSLRTVESPLSHVPRLPGSGFAERDTGIGGIGGRARRLLDITRRLLDIRGAAPVSPVAKLLAGGAITYGVGKSLIDLLGTRVPVVGESPSFRSPFELGPGKSETEMVKRRGLETPKGIEKAGQGSAGRPAGKAPAGAVAGGIDPKTGKMAYFDAKHERIE